MSSIVIAGDTSGSVTLQAPAVAGSTTITLPATSGTLLQSGTTVTEAQGGIGTTVGYNGFKNRIINGDMRIDQRNAGASVTGIVGSVYPVDRWPVYSTIAGKLTTQQSTTAPANFINSVVVTSTAATTFAATDEYEIWQKIEGLNVADFGWGTTNAKPFTLSFWVRSSLTGTFGGTATNGSYNRSYVFSYTINTANTWEQKTITISGDTTGTWLTNNGNGLYLAFDLGSGTSYRTTAGAWNSGYYTAPTGAVSVLGTNGATFYITGVQLEKGSTATSFDVRPYATELTLCQRYYWSKALETNYSSIASGAMITTSIARMNVAYPTKMRTSPTITTSNIGNSIISTGLDLNPSGTFTAYANTTSAMMDIDTPATGTVGRGAVWIFGATATTLAASAEL